MAVKLPLNICPRLVKLGSVAKTHDFMQRTRKAEAQPTTEKIMVYHLFLVFAYEKMRYDFFRKL